MASPDPIHRRLAGSLRHAIAAMLLATASLAASGGADAATTTRLDFNIAVDPGAEAATGGTGAVVPIPLWSTTSTMTAVAYGAPGFPSTAYAGTIKGGKDLFYCGRGTAASSARQKIKISGRNELIDSGQLKLQTTIRMGTTADDGDAGQLVVRFLNANGKILGSLSSATVANTVGVMNRILTDAPVPAHTRALRVIVQGTAGAGPDCDVVFDNVSIHLTNVS